MRIVVDLPAPLGPSRPTQVPTGTSRSRPLTAVIGPYRLTAPRSRMASSPVTPPRMPARSGRGHRLVPEAEGSDEGVLVRPEPRVRGQLLQQLRVPPSEHNVVGLERLAQKLDGLGHRLSPALL